MTISVPSGVKREIDRIANKDGLSRSDVVREALDQHLFVRRFRDLRQRMMARAQAQGVFTDEDVFNRLR